MKKREVAPSMGVVCMTVGKANKPNSLKMAVGCCTVVFYLKVRQFLKKKSRTILRPLNSIKKDVIIVKSNIKSVSELSNFSNDINFLKLVVKNTQINFRD